MGGASVGSTRSKGGTGTAAIAWAGRLSSSGGRATVLRADNTGSAADGLTETVSGKRDLAASFTTVKCREVSAEGARDSASNVPVLARSISGSESLVAYVHRCERVVCRSFPIGRTEV